jgi:hypothetical protein
VEEFDSTKEPSEFKQGDFLDILKLYCFICRPSDSTVSEDAGIEPRTVNFEFEF